MNKPATATHRVFDVLRGHYPVTYRNVREADPEGLLDIFEGSNGTRDAYFEAVDYNCLYKLPYTAGCEWADYLEGFDPDHGDDCDQGPGAPKSSDPCNCKTKQWKNNHQWGRDLCEAIQQRIAELND